MKKCIQFTILSALFCYTAATAQNVRFIRVGTSEPFTPLYQDEDGLDTLHVKGMTQSSASNRKWFRIAAEYSTDAEWLDRLTLEYYVLFPGATNVFKGTVHYVDIPRGHEHLSEMYLHFNSYARYYKRGVVQYAVVALIDGKQLAVETNKRLPENWWKNMSIHSCGLLDRNMTPFFVVNAEKFAAQNPVNENK